MYTDTVKEILVEKNPVKTEFAQITAVLFITIANSVSRILALSSHSVRPSVRRAQA